MKRSRIVGWYCPNECGDGKDGKFLNFLHWIKTDKSLYYWHHITKLIVCTEEKVNIYNLIHHCSGNNKDLLMYGPSSSYPIFL